jgi:hypothetical protein
VSALKVGDKIRILQDRLDCAIVEVGDILEVTGFESTENFIAERWWFGKSDEGKGWERYEEDE